MRVAIATDSLIIAIICFVFEIVLNRDGLKTKIFGLGLEDGGFGLGTQGLGLVLS